jgi:O-antigen/teichoic acid export membrane protein
MEFIKLIILNFFKGHSRTVKAKKQIIYSLFLKGISIVIGLMFVPLLLNYLDAERYGIWLTLSSVIGWFSFFDFGLGNGLRNRFAEAIAKNNDELAKTYVSTTYAILGAVFFAIIIIYYVVNPFINWQKVLNTNIVGARELSIVALIVFTFFVLQFLFRLIGTIAIADQRPALNSSLVLLGNLIALIVIFILTKTTKGSLVVLASVLSFAPLLVLATATFYFFHKDYKKYSPSFAYIDLTKSKDLLGLGIKFFFIQVAEVIFFSTTNFLIAQFANQESVAAYNVAYKYFYTVNMAYFILLSPFWSAVTDAYSKNDYGWIKASLRKLNILSGAVVVCLIILLLISPYIYKMWIGNKLFIPFSLSLIITIYLIIQVISSPFTNFINGFGKLKLGLYLIALKLIVFIPLAILLGQKFGALGIIISMVLIQSTALIFEPIQTYKLINQKAYGIWNK